VAGLFRVGPSSSSVPATVADAAVVGLTALPLPARVGGNGLQEVQGHLGVGVGRGMHIGCPRNEKNKISVRTETNRNKICFAFVSVCFVKPKKTNFRFVSVFRTLIETTETNRTISKRTETMTNSP
jgi:hypothetical protein